MLDLSSPAILISGLLISLVGMGAFVYGRKAQDVGALGLGVILMVYPMFVHSVLVMWLIGGACTAAWWFLLRPR